MQKLLIIEDNDMIAKAMKSLLDKNGYLVDVAENGKQGLEMTDKTEYDIVITDLMLPYVNGLEIIAKLKSDVSKRNLKIIVVSAIGNELTIADAFKHGADDYLIKPVVANELLTRVRKVS